MTPPLEVAATFAARRPQATPPRMPWERFYKACRNLISVQSNVKWYDYQRDIARRVIQAIVEHEATEIVIQLPRQSGKSEIVADLCCSVMELAPLVYPDSWSRGFKVGFFAPKYDLTQIIYNRMRDRLNPEVLGALGMTVSTSNGDTCTLSNGSSAKSLTANRGSFTEGYTFDLLVIDEAQNVDTEVLLKSIYPMGTATAATRVLIGTATTVKRYFYELQQNARGTDRIFVLDVERIIADRKKMAHATNSNWHLNYEKDFRKQLAARGKDDFIRMAYYGEWILERGMLITEQRLTELALPYDRVRSYEHECYAGMDLGKLNDSTVFTIGSFHAPADLSIELTNGDVAFVKKGDVLWDEPAQRHHFFVLDWVEFLGDRYTEQMKVLADYVKHGFPNLRNLTWDRTGVGVGVDDIVYEEFRKVVLPSGKNLYEIANGFQFGQSPQVLSDFWDDINVHMVSRGLIHFPMGASFQRYTPEGRLVGLLTHPNLDKESRAFVKQFTDVQKVYRGQMLKCEVEEGGNKHDDYPASLALCNWGTRHFGGLRIEVAPASFDEKTGKASGTLTVDSLFEEAPTSEQSKEDFFTGGAYSL